MQMPEMTPTIRDEVGQHARPAALFVQTAKGYDCDIIGLVLGILPGGEYGRTLSPL